MILSLNLSLTNYDKLPRASFQRDFFMQIDILNHSSFTIKDNQIIHLANQIFYLLAKRQVKPSPSIKTLTIVFKDEKDVQMLNKEFRTKDRSTDALSFHPIEATSLGEIVLAVQKIQLQADKNQHSFLDEIGYLTLHGILHLLGYEHESDQEKAEEMMNLQDDVFEELRYSKLNSF